MPRSRIVLCSAIAAGAVLSLIGAGAASAHPSPKPSGPAVAVADAYQLSEGHSLKVRDSVLANDRGAEASIVSHSTPANGVLTMNQDGTFGYVPKAGFTGVDSFTYTVNDAVKLSSTNLPPLATIGGVKITGGGYGSSLAPVPGSKDEFYGLTDRGPNVDAPTGKNKIEPIPGFTPAIGKFRLTGTDAVLEKKITLKAANGSPYNGQVNTQAGTGETIEDLNGTVLPASPYGYDPEGLVALKDGSFWVSDEYGPFITHFDRDGRQIGRLSPFDGSPPAELAQRVPNKGMEGLTLTPDGTTLVGMMQSALQTPDLTAKPANVTTVRIVTYSLSSHATHEYIYLLNDPKTNSGAISEITAVSNTKFIVDERDGHAEPGAFKQLYSIDISGATDVGPKSTVTGSAYAPAQGGLLVGSAQKSIEATVGTDPTAVATADLTAVGITPVAKSDYVDLGALLTKLDPTGGFFGHDKIEGVATTDGGRTLVISNESDFGVDAVTNTVAPFQLHAKLLPNGQQDDGQFLTIDTSKLADASSTATVSIFVTPKDTHFER